MRILFALLNLLGIPGLGTLLSGQRCAGVIQLVLSIIGLLLSIYSTGIIGKKLLTSGLPYLELGPALLAGELMPLTEFFFLFGLALLGMVFFATAWIWSAFTTLPRPSTPPPIPKTL